jgi:hypothetical protein
VTDLEWCRELPSETLRWIEEVRRERTAVLKAAIERAEGPYQALIASPAWDSAEGVALPALFRHPGGDRVGFVGEVWNCFYYMHGVSHFTFGRTVTLREEGDSFLRTKSQVVLEISGSLLPILDWWETGAVAPQRPDPETVRMDAVFQAFPAVLYLCALLAEGRLLDVIRRQPAGGDA